MQIAVNRDEPKCCLDLKQLLEESLFVFWVEKHLCDIRN